MADSEEDGGGGIDGRTIALGALALAGIVLVVRVLRSGGESEEEAGFEFGDEDDESDETDAGETDDGAATDDLPVDAPEGVSDRFDEIDVVDAVYILVAGLKAAREEYRKRTDEGGA